MLDFGSRDDWISFADPDVKDVAQENPQNVISSFWQVQDKVEKDNMVEF